MRVQSRGGSGDSGCARGPPSPPSNKPCKPICLIVIIEYSYIKLLDTFTFHNITDPRLPSKQRLATCRTRSRSHFEHVQCSGEMQYIVSISTPGHWRYTYISPKVPYPNQEKKKTSIKHSPEGRIVSSTPYKKGKGVSIIHAPSTQNNAVPTSSNPEPSKDLTTNEVQ